MGSTMVASSSKVDSSMVASSNSMLGDSLGGNSRVGSSMGVISMLDKGNSSLMVSSILDKGSSMVVFSLVDSCRVVLDNRLVRDREVVWFEKVRRAQGPLLAS